MNPLRVINLALKTSGVLGVGQTANAEDTNDAFTMLNMMVAHWTRKRWLVPNEIDVACMSTGAQSYTIGLNQDFNTIRPDELEAAYIRLLNNSAVPLSSTVDYPLDIIEAHEDYAFLTLKQLVGFPTSIFYDSAYPIGRIYVWPIPNQSYEIHLILKNTLNQFPDLQTENGLPPEYDAALMWNLAAELRPMYGLPPEPTIIIRAKTTLATIRGANSQIPDLQIPNGWTRNGRSGRYNTGGPREGAFRTDVTGLT